MCLVVVVVVVSLNKLYIHFEICFACCCYCFQCQHSVTAHTFHNLNSFFLRFITLAALVVGYRRCLLLLFLQLLLLLLLLPHAPHKLAHKHEQQLNIFHYFHYYNYTYIPFRRGWQRNAIFLFQLIFFSYSHSFFHVAFATDSWSILSHL